MGQGQLTYVGPYLECRNGAKAARGMPPVGATAPRLLAVVRVVEHRCEGCGARGAGPFCCRCGGRVAPTDVNRTVPPIGREAECGAAGEALSAAQLTGDSHYFVPNQNRDAPGRPPAGEPALPPGEEAGKCEVDWFGAAFAAEIAALTALYPAVEVRWGILRWYN